MKYLITLLFGFSLTCFAQNGGLNLTILDNPSLGPITVSIYAQEDSTQRFIGVTDANGQITIDKLPAGMQSLRFSFLGKEFGYRNFFLQDRQMLSTTLLIDTLLEGMTANDYGKYEIGLGQSLTDNLNNSLISRDAGVSGATITRADITAMPVRSCCATRVMSINEVAVVAYRAPLIDMNAGATGVNYSNSEIREMPMRDAATMATTVGGVLSFGDANELHVRGARSDATNYYIDGVRVRSLPNVPQSSMNQVTVYTGGIPASYGDFTGGIISVESKSYFDLYRSWQSQQLRNDYYSPSPAPQPEVVVEVAEVSEPQETEVIIEEPVEILEPRISADRFPPDL